MPGHHKNPKSSKHWFRMVVPVDLRAKVGRSEIKHSLGTSNDLEADALRAKHRQDWTARFAELRQEKAQEDLAQAPIVVDEFLRMLADRRDGDIDSVMYGLQKLLTVKLLTAWGPHEFEGRGADRAVAFMPEIDAWEGQPDPCSDIIPEDERDRLVARIRLLHHHPGTFGAGFREAIRYVSSGRRWDAVRSDVMMIEEFTGRTIDHGTAFYDAVAEAYVQRLLEHFSYRWDPALLDDLDPPAGHQDAFPAPQHPQVQAEERTVPPTDTNHGRSSESMSPLSAGFQKWIKVAAPGASAIREAGRAVERFIELFGDKPVAEITEDDLFNHRDFVEAMPANLSLPAIKASGLSLREAVEQAWADKPERAKLSPTSVKKEMSAFSAIFGALKSERWIRFNLAADIRVSGYSKARTKQKSPRLDVRGRSHALKVNYRTSHQIRTAADRLLPSVIADMDGVEEGRRGTVSMFDGRLPDLQLADDEDGELATVAGFVRECVASGMSHGEICILFRSSRQAARARAAAKQADAPFVELSDARDCDATRLSLATMHQAKGLEFRAVAVMACDEDALPDPDRLANVGDEADLEEAFDTERHLLYVACTRARDRLLISGVAPGSEFLADLQL